MFSDPQSVTVNSVAKSMPRVAVGDLTATYQNNDETYTLVISHQVTNRGRIRTNARLEHRGIVTNPLDSSNDYDTLVFSSVLDRPGYGFTVDDVKYHVNAFKAWLTDSVIEKLFGKES